MDHPQFTRRAAPLAVGRMGLSSAATTQSDKYPKNLTREDTVL
jgi:hypothetical protein